MQCPAFLTATLVAFALAALALPAGAAEQGAAPPPGTPFRDCAECPEMVVVPPGSFRMGDLAGIGLNNERPAHEVTIPRAFAIGKYEVTFAEWDACVAAGGCTHHADDRNWGRGRRPVSDVNWDDAQEYVAWLSARTGENYRLPAEAEWEYAARAGTTTPYPWGEELGEGNAICLSCGVGFVMTKEVGELAPNAFGLHDMIGLNREWVADCWSTTYDGAPADGSARQDGDCSYRITRGGNWYDSARFLRSASRAGLMSERFDNIGFRVARDL